MVSFSVSVSGVLFDGCVLNAANENGTRVNDMYVLCQELGIDISHSRCKYIIYSGIVLIPTMMFARLMVDCAPASSI